MKIRTKLLLGYSVVALWSLVVGYIGESTTKEVKQAFDNLGKETISVIESLEEIRFGGVRLIASTSEFGFILAEKSAADAKNEVIEQKGEEGEEDFLKMGTSKIDVSVAAYKALISQFEREGVFLKIIKTTTVELKKLSQQLVQLKKQGKSGVVILQAKEAFEISEKKFLDSIMNALKYENKQLKSRSLLLASKIEQGRNKLLIISFFNLLLAVIIGFIMSHIISNPLAQLTRATKRIGEGELNTQITLNSEDEIGELAQAFNQMSKKLKITAKLSVEKDYVDNILLSMYDTLVVIKPDGTILSMNRALEELLDYTEQELTGKNIDTLLQYENTDGNAKSFQGGYLRKLIKEGAAKGVEIYYIHKSGREIPMLFSGSVMKNKIGNAQAIVCVAQDMTARKYAEIKLKESHQKLIKVNKELIKTQAQLVQSAKLASVGELATGVAHELNQPLSIISMSAGLQLKQIQKQHFDENEETYQLIINQVERATAIINHLRTFGRESDNDVRSLNNVNKMVEDSFIILNEHFRLHDIEVIKDLSSEELLVESNLVQIEQVFTNLLNNAKDALIDMDVKKLRVKTWQRDNTVIIEIEDSGSGIAEVDLDKIFDPFFTTKEVGKGTGLGLSISHGIISDHGGILSVKSVLGQGSTFRIELLLNKGVS